jgi:hypothetical protein
MPRLSSTSTGTDVTVEPKLVSKPVNELTDDELAAEIERLRGQRGVAVSSGKTRGGPAAPRGPIAIEEGDLG